MKTKVRSRLHDLGSELITSADEVCFFRFHNQRNLDVRSRRRRDHATTPGVSRRIAELR